MSSPRLIFSGWQLGSDPEIQVATNVTNHLTAAIMKYFTDSFRLERAANLFEKMSEREPEIAALLARSYIGMSKWSTSESLQPWSKSGLPVYMLMSDHRRGDQGCQNHAHRPPTTPSIISHPPRPMRFPTLQRQAPMGPESGSTSRQFRSFGIRDLGQIDRDVH